MAIENWQAALMSLLIAGMVAAGVRVLLDRFWQTSKRRWAVAVAAWTAYLYLGVVIDPSYRHEPVLFGVTFGLLGVAAAQLGELVSPRSRRGAA